MVRILAVMLAVLVTSSSSRGIAAGSETQTMTGWFSDAECATPRVAKGIIRPNGSACVKRCLDDGATPVFISEQAKALFEVKGYDRVKDDVEYHVEVTGTIDEAGKTISVTSVKRLEPIEATCAVPRRTGGTKK